MNGKAFANLPKLKIIQIESYCIEEWYSGKDIKKTGLEQISSSCGFDEFDFEEILCERFDDFELDEYCVMTGKTAINTTNFVIAEVRDEEVQGIDFDENERIEYLPYKIYKQLPNIARYTAKKCSIIEITKENFEKLNKFRMVLLDANRIRKIFGNTFEGLKSLSFVNLGKVLFV